ncbi:MULTISPECIES: hypothetical protein [unclassified Streptomyces]|uniref:hypothetical protein n=1 Tax=unclassified Streptomyces TaxID=2593676 RepID=UPI00081DD2C7|nr:MULTISPECIES: hypothetical protein [unclassified Streptomyces]MYR93068.1 hypothetical protein [Streptomyces sp. SID4937]SCD45945.1 hypothetical protein GA0115243_102148 [Streptomyces sp. ScaeMP-e83]
MSVILGIAGLLLTAAAAYVVFVRPSKNAYAAIAVASALLTIWRIAADQEPSTTIIQAVGTAIYAYLWWHNGGGNDTRRRLREAARPFKAVRRTAPVTT